ncbi:alpha-E domain-containing protein [Asticcacaulis sp. EMRT-3]|uniref:alpha-E domain-containing protein n=1 Tax=Asticcacaulis sp. EMRT-3 TaxID=3040349 RepID=UPI0024AFB83A|nr:alpha-E domain-containing protein [Asticcacaulis sp. EMRT-3]MDI7776327.1 alpha-E domain-containing protein [Asticcacaulis sp. EMRT-3]
MLSRVANSLYWMARYLERADNVARFIDVNSHLTLDLALPDDSQQWHPLISASGDDEDFYSRYKAADERSVVRFLTFDAQNPNSILSSIYRARENARTVREVIPVEMWEKINALYHLTQAHSRKRSVADLQDYYKEVRQSGHLLTGLMYNTMSREQGWQFAHIGQMLERADKTARLLDVKYFLLSPRHHAADTAYDAVQWGAVLKSVHALEMYRQQYHSINYRDVTAFLLFSHAFPRSVLFCLHEAARDLDALDHAATTPNRARAEMAILIRTIETSSASHIIASGLHEFIDLVQANLNLVDEAVELSFFKT